MKRPGSAGRGANVLPRTVLTGVVFAGTGAEFFRGEPKAADVAKNGEP